MGRHSASYIAAQQALSTGPTAVSAARYVGRVGALALAMGVGAAVVGGAGLAHADGATDNGPAGGGGVQSSPDPTDGEAGPAEDPSTNGFTGVKTRRPSLLDVPKMVFGGGAPTRRPGTVEAGPGSLPGLIARIPNQIAAAFDQDATGAGSPTGVRNAPQASSRGSSRPNDHPRPARPSIQGEEAVTSFVRAKTDDLAATFRAAAPPVAVVVSSAPVVNRQQRLTVASFTATVPQSATEFAAPAQDARAQAAPRLAHPVATLVSGILTTLGFSPSASTGGSPVAPMPMVLGALQLISRELERISVNHASSTAVFSSAQTYANPAIAPGVPSPGDEVHTAYGDVGKWMLQSNGQVSNYGGQPYNGKALLEPVNIIIVDPTSKTPAEATRKLNAAMFWAGFPAQPIHSTGFQGRIDDVTYGQQPTGLLQGFSDNLFVLPNDHGRIFGPDPVETSTGYVWSGAFSTETLGIYNFLPTHTYVSSNMARTALAMRLICGGQATYVGTVPLDNAYNTATTTTGDHDGYAVVLQLK